MHHFDFHSDADHSELAHLYFWQLSVDHTNTKRVFADDLTNY